VRHAVHKSSNSDEHIVHQEDVLVLSYTVEYKNYNLMITIKLRKKKLFLGESPSIYCLSASPIELK
jgi:hypothetical protein